MKLIGCSNAGWSFSLTRIKQVNSMYLVLCQLDQNKKYSYIDLQNEIEKSVLMLMLVK